MRLMSSTMVNGCYCCSYFGINYFWWCKCSIANVATAVVPFMAIIYILMAVINVSAPIYSVSVICINFTYEAFGFTTAFGGIVGAMIEIGVKRGLYSNEACSRYRTNTSSGSRSIIFQVNKV